MDDLENELVGLVRAITEPLKEKLEQAESRAQHMDELVEAARQLEANIMDNDELKLSLVSHISVKKLRDRLAKIDGGK